MKIQSGSLLQGGVPLTGMEEKSKIFGPGSFPVGEELKHAIHASSQDELNATIVYYAESLFAHDIPESDPGEIMASFIGLMSQKLDEGRFKNFLDAAWSTGCGPERISRVFVDGVIAWEKHKIDRQPDRQFALAVAMTCELGVFLIQKLHDQSGWTPEKTDDSLQSVTSYLFSLSNLQNSCVRLSLIRYFGVLSAYQVDHSQLSRIMGRFGHSMLYQLLVLLNDKKSSGYAFSYLLENIPFYFMPEGAHQKMVHETFNNYMLKQPEVLTAFLKKLAKNLKKSDEKYQAACREVFCTHLGALLRTASDINRKSLIWEILSAIEEASDLPTRNRYIKALTDSPTCAGSLKSFLREISKGSCRAKHGNHITIARKTLGKSSARKINLTCIKGAGAIIQMSSLSCHSQVA